MGVDPGLANTGWAIIEVAGDSDEPRLVECGCIRTEVKEESAVRLAKIYKKLEELMKKFKVEVLVVEKIFFARNVKSATKVAEAIGVIKVCGQRCGVRVAEYTPLQVKMSLVGYGRAEKEQVEVMVRNFLKLEDLVSPAHAADAAAVALTHVFTNEELL